jgi:hypothetical protein
MRWPPQPEWEIIGNPEPTEEAIAALASLLLEMVEAEGGEAEPTTRRFSK